MADIVQDVENEGLAGLFGAEASRDQDPQVYEVGYHFLPTLSDDEAAAAAKDLGNFLKKEGAVTVGEHAPTKVDLVYTIEYRVGGKIQGAKTAHFGWVAFELVPGSIATVKKFMDTNPAVLRFLITSTTTDEVNAVLEGKVIMPTATASTEAIAAPKRAVEEGAVVSDEALTKALDTMSDEDAGKKAE